MEPFAEYLERVENPQYQDRLQNIFHWITATFPTLRPKIAWNQPMFTDHGTFIIGFSVAKKHLAIAPERAGIERFSDDILQAGYTHSKEILRIGWTQSVDFPLLERIIRFNLEEKANCQTFWRKGRLRTEELPDHATERH